MQKDESTLEVTFESCVQELGVEYSTMCLIPDYIRIICIIINQYRCIFSAVRKADTQ